MADAMTIRELLVHLGVTTDAKRLAEFDEGLKHIKDGMQRAVKAAAWLSAGISGAVTGAGLLSLQAADTAESLTQTAETLGITTDALQEYRHVFDQFPVGADYVAIAFNKVNQQAQNALRGSTDLASAFSTIGIAIGELRDKQPDQLFEMIAAGVAATQDPVKRLDALTRIFGDDLTTKIAPALAGGAAGIRQLREQARAYGLVLDKDLIQRGNAAKAQFQLMRGVIASLRTEIGLHLIPVFLSVVNRVLDFVKSNRAWISLKIEEAVQRIEKTMVDLERAVKRVDKEVQERFGSWENLFIQVGKAAAFAAGGRGLLALVRTAVALKMAVSGAAAAIGAMSAAAIVGGLVVAGLVAGLTGLLLVLDDIRAFLRGGDSLIGDLATWVGIDDELKATLVEFQAAWDEFTTELGRAARDLKVEIAEALGISLEDLDKILDEIVKSPIREFFRDMIELVEGLTSALRFLTSALRGEGFAQLPQTLDEGAQALSANPFVGRVLFPGAGATGGAVTQGLGWLWTRLRSDATGGATNQSTTNQSVEFGPTTWNVNGGANTTELEAMARRREEEQRRQAFAVFAGGAR